MNGMIRWRILAVLTVCVGRAESPQPRTIRYADLPPGIARRFDAATFDAHIQDLERNTALREREGEFDHLVYYLLQSQRFTSLPRIEPAVSARELGESAAVPPAVAARTQAFLRAIARPGADPRLRYFARLLNAQERTIGFLEGQYRRAMRFLYDKEVLGRAHVYETRGHSTDTQVEANYAVWSALSVLRQVAPGTRIRRVLIIGPGMDFAPRTALFDSAEPQSFQPYAVADALIALGLANGDALTIDCADINQRVITFLNDFPRGPRRLELYSGPGDAGYARYFNELGASIGGLTPHAAFAKTLTVRAGVARDITALKMNILTERVPQAYDLAIATNVLVYFNAGELALALANTSAMLVPGGYFLHNELRPELDELSAAAGLEPVQARTIRITEGRSAPLFDAFALYRKQ